MRGPEPKQKRKAQKAETSTVQQAALKSDALKKPPAQSPPKEAAATVEQIEEATDWALLRLRTSVTDRHALPLARLQPSA